jgi:hypothetical protein
LSGLRNREILNDRPIRKIRVELTTLDIVCHDLPKLDFLKLDLEGAEMDALHAGRLTLQKFRPVVALEQSQDSPRYFSYTWEDLLGYFASLGYEIYDLFGLRYTEPAMLDRCSVWDFVGLPAEYPDKDALFGAVRRSMQAKGVMPPDAGASQHLGCSGSAPACCIDGIGSVSSPGTQSSVNVPGDQSIEFSGWAIDDQNKAPAGSVDIVVDDELYSAVYGEERRDVAEHFENSSYLNSGFRLTLSPGALDKGRHIVSLRVLSRDKKSYRQGPRVAFTVD